MDASAATAGTIGGLDNRGGPHHVSQADGFAVAGRLRLLPLIVRSAHRGSQARNETS